MSLFQRSLNNVGFPLLRSKMALPFSDNLIISQTQYLCDCKLLRAAGNGIPFSAMSQGVAMSRDMAEGPKEQSSTLNKSVLSVLLFDSQHIPTHPLPTEEIAFGKNKDFELCRDPDLQCVLAYYCGIKVSIQTFIQHHFVKIMPSCSLL